MPRKTDRQKVLKAMMLLSRTLMDNKIDIYIGAAAMMTLGTLALADQDYDKDEWLEWISDTWDDTDNIFRKAREFHAKRRRGTFKVVGDPN